MAAEFVTVKGLEGVYRSLRAMPAEIVSKRGGPVRRALRKASLLIVNEMKANVQRIIDEPNLGGTVDASGLAIDNIVTTRQKMPGGLKGERFKVGPRLRKKYPRKSEGSQEVTVVQNLRLLETGTENRRPMPWARPAFDSKKHAVPGIFEKELRKDLQRIAKRIAKQNGVG
jgi:HK97 gp10 family phage protein